MIFFKNLSNISLQTRKLSGSSLISSPTGWLRSLENLTFPLLNSVFTAASRVFFGPPKRRSALDQVKKGSKPLHELLTSPPPWVDFPSMVAFRKREALELIAVFRAENASRETLLGHDAIVEDACRAVAIRTCTEFEGNYLDTYRKLKGRPIIPVGLLPPEELPVDERTLACQPNWKKISKWLDEQKPRSVVFVGFGSECKLSKNQVYEIANGVQLSGLPFLWILQKPRWALNDIDALPSDFGTAMEGKGLVHIGWAPQKEILAHPSIGGSLFHAGWGSVIETLQHGHVLVVLPFVFDQGLNARLLVEKGVAIEVRRNDEDGSFSENDIAMSLREAMVSEGGEGLRAQARKVAAIFRDQKLHDSYVRNFAQYLKAAADVSEGSNCSVLWT